MKIFCQCVFSGILPFFSSLLYSLFLLISSPSLSSSHCIYNAVSVNIPTVSYFFYNFIDIRFEFQFQHHYFLFLCCNFIFLGQFCLSVIHFCKISCGFITRRWEGSTTTALLRLRELDNRCTVTNHWQAFIGVTWLLTEYVCICYLHSDLWTGELAIMQLFNENCWVSHI